MALSLRDRARFINLSQVRLSQLAGVDKHTVGRVLAGDRNVLRSSEAAVAAALVAEERRVLNHLMTLHLLGEPHVRAHADLIPPQMIERGGGEMAGLA